MIRTALRLTRFPLLTKNNASTIVDDAATYGRSSVLTSRYVCTTTPCGKEIRMQTEKTRVGRSSKYGLLLEGEATLETTNINQQKQLFPDKNTPNRLFNGVPFSNVHIINIKSTPNNTIMNIIDHTGKALTLHSSGVEGFKNAKKGTNIAAQQAAITLGNRIREYGINMVRVRVQGIGPGRMSSIKGLQMTGLNIISITDNTRVSWNPPRPRKQRRV